MCSLVKHELKMLLIKNNCANSDLFSMLTHWIRMNKIYHVTLQKYISVTHILLINKCLSQRVEALFCNTSVHYVT